MGRELRLLHAVAARRFARLEPHENGLVIDLRLLHPRERHAFLRFCMGWAVLRQPRWYKGKWLLQIADEETRRLQGQSGHVIWRWERRTRHYALHLLYLYWRQAMAWQKDKGEQDDRRK